MPRKPQKEKSSLEVQQKCKHKHLFKDVVYGDIVVVCHDCQAWTAVQNDDFKSIKRLRELLNELILPAKEEPIERTCVHCGCTDSRACRGGCSWVITHKFTPTGVCSQCVATEIKLVDSL